MTPIAIPAVGKTTLAIAAVTAVMLAAIACTKGGEPSAAAAAETTAATLDAKASCSMIAALGTCNEYPRSTSLGLEKSLCEGVKGSFTNAPCPAAGQVGACAVPGGEVKRYYGAAAAGERALTAAEAKADCESDLVKGSFRPASARE